MGTVRMRIYLLTALLLTGSLMACKKEPDPVAASATAQGYVNEVVSRMQAHSINRKAIDWTAFRAQVNTKAQGAQTIPDTNPALQLALTLLGDNHSYYITASGASLYGQRPQGLMVSGASLYTLAHVGLNTFLRGRTTCRRKTTPRGANTTHFQAFLYPTVTAWRCGDI